MVLPITAPLVACLERLLLARLLARRSVLASVGTTVRRRDLHVHLNLIHDETLSAQGLQDIALVVLQLAQGSRVVDGQLDAEFFA